MFGEKILVEKNAINYFQEILYLIFNTKIEILCTYLQRIIFIEINKPLFFIKWVLNANWKFINKINTTIL